MSKQDTRVRMALDRVVGMYRLMAEEKLGRTGVIEINLDKNAMRRVGKWNQFKRMAWEEAEKSIIEKIPELVAAELKTDSHSAAGLYYPADITGVMFPRQRICIRHGIAMENAVRRLVDSHTRPVSAKVYSALNRQFDKVVQLDILRDFGNAVRYFELKYSLQHDTEKVEGVVNKVDRVQIALLDAFGNRKDVTSRIVSLSHPTCGSMRGLRPGYAAVKDTHLMGYVEFFASMGIYVTEEMWQTLHHEIGQACFNAFCEYIED